MVNRLGVVGIVFGAIASLGSLTNLTIYGLSFREDKSPVIKKYESIYGKGTFLFDGILMAGAGAVSFATTKLRKKERIAEDEDGQLYFDFMKDYD